MSHRKDPANAANIKKRRDQMNLRGWTMGMVTIMPNIVAKPASAHHTPITAQLDSFKNV